MRLRNVRFPAVSERGFNQAVVGFVALGFLTLLVGVAAVGWIAAQNEDRTAWVTHSYGVERLITAFRLQVVTLQASRRGYLLTGDSGFQSDFSSAQSSLFDDLARLRRLTAENPRQQARITQLATLSSRMAALLKGSMTDFDAGQPELALKAVATDGSVALAQQADQIAQAMLAEENGLLTLRQSRRTSASELFGGVLTVLGVLVLALAAGSVLIIQRYTHDLAASRDSLKRLNEHLEEMVEARTMDLQRANDEIQRFAYIVSHDLRSPLVNVLGFTGELESAAKALGALVDRAETEAPQLVTAEAKRAVREDMPEAIGFILASTHKMDRLINAILKLSRQGRRTITPEPLDMNAVLQDAADTLRQRALDAGAEILIEGPLPPIVSDRLALEQIFSNLLENAIKYPQPGRPGRIVLSGRRAGERVVYEVADNGRGIDPKDHDRIFDLFRRSGVQDQPGEGIGLAHVRALAYRLGGLVSCRSVLGQGAVFSVSLPANFAGYTSP
ncbi:MAG TPA: ATP-binding protein [Caulobacteraceae bacterium]|nr:ATP-binding protein [Caulobacteraceae bacterium]